MNKKLFITTAITAAGTVGAKLTADKIKNHLASPDNKRKLADTGHSLAMKLIGKVSDSVSDKGIPYVNRYDNSGFMDGNGYFITEPSKDARWSVGFDKASVVPPIQEGDYYIGGYLAYPPNKMTGIMNEQMVRALALSDGSGRGIHIFAVIDCIGISGTDIRKIRKRLKALISEKNILSVNISATHCHSGIDTEGLWGELPKAFKNNKKAAKKGKKGNYISGKNEIFMGYLERMAEKAITNAVNNMKTGRLSYVNIPVGDYVRDKRPPYVTDNNLTRLRFVPDDNSKEINLIFMAAHPVCYGDKQKEASRDFPGYMCDEMEKQGVEAMFIQGAQAAVATNRGPHIPDGLGTDEGIRAYGEALAHLALEVNENNFTELPPVINVSITELFLSAENKILELAAKLRLVNNPLVKITMADDSNKDDKSYDLSLVTEVGFAVLGNMLTLAMVPGELMPELAVGGCAEGWESYSGEDWQLPSIKDIMGTDLAVIGLCNDFIGYIVPDNDYGSIFAPLHYEESVSAGRKTASEIIGAFMRLKKHSEEITITKSQTINE